MANMNTTKHKTILDTALKNLPSEFRDGLIETYLELKRKNSESQYDYAGISAGKFCEVLIRMLQSEITGTYTAFGDSIGNMADECRKLVNSPKTAAIESLRVIIPRALIFLYTIRNKRGIGHIGGDVDANKIDLTAIVVTADWIICELIRIYHGLSLEEAQDLVDGISFKSIPAIWEIAGKKRVLKQGLSSQHQVLLLLYSTTDVTVLSEDLCNWIEYTNLSMFKKRVLEPLHNKRLIEYEKETETVYLSPLGAKEVELRVINSA
jgi:hypothetical protein